MKEKQLISPDGEQALEALGELPSELVQNWGSNIRKASARRRYSEKFRKFASTLYYHSPRAYTYVSSIFPMPSRQTIRTWLKILDAWPGFTQEALDHIRETLEGKSEREKLCCIMLDGMSIRKKCDLDTKSGRLIGYVDLGNSQSTLDTDETGLAGDALVLMAVGVAAPWKVPFAYFLNNGLTGEALQNILREAIAQLTECSANVVAVVCDALAANVSMGKLLGCRIHESNSDSFQTSFAHPDKPAQRISLIFDAAHGLKLLRNLLGDKKVLRSTYYGVGNLCIFDRFTVSHHILLYRLLSGPTSRGCKSSKRLKGFVLQTSSEGAISSITGK